VALWEWNNCGYVAVEDMLQNVCVGGLGRIYFMPLGQGKRQQGVLKELLVVVVPV
jgi:hypothetical protein